MSQVAGYLYGMDKQNDHRLSCQQLPKASFLKTLQFFISKPNLPSLSLIPIIAFNSRSQRTLRLIVSAYYLAGLLQKICFYFVKVFSHPSGSLLLHKRKHKGKYQMQCLIFSQIVKRKVPTAWILDTKLLIKLD